MDNKSCINNEHQYGLWNSDNENKTAWRICEKCMFKRELPITNEIKDQLKKQEEASKIFQAFQLVMDTDKDIINYLELIIEDYINYLNKTDFNLLIKRIKKLEKLDIIDAKNILYLNQLETYFIIDDININTTNNDFDSNTNQEEQTIKLDF